MHNNDHNADADPDENGVNLPDSARYGAERRAEQQQRLSAESADDASTAEDFPDKEESLIEESLHHALSDLEQILARHKGADENAGESIGKDAGERADEGLADKSANESIIDEETVQYVIPLLEEVVIPGAEGHATMPAPAPTQSVSEAHIDDADEPALRRRLAERLASEIDIIAQDRIEAALETARKEIRVQIRNHLDIILPEVAEELNQLRRRLKTQNSDND